MKRIKQHSLVSMLAAIYMGSLCATAMGDTVIIANPGGGQNSGVPDTFGDQVTTSSSGAYADAFAVSGTPVGTPNIDLTWSAVENRSGGSTLRWEFHNWGGSSTADGGALQLNGSQGGTGGTDPFLANDIHQVTFTPDTGIGVIIKTFNFVGDTDGDIYQYNWRVVQVSDSQVVASGQTPQWTTDGSQIARPPWDGAPSVEINYTGAIDEALRLEIAQSIGSEGSGVDISIDNLAFAQHGTPQSPSFVTNPISSGDARATVAYTGSIASQASDPTNDPLGFAKIDGPTWLNVATNGTLSGTPSLDDMGLNQFTVLVTDNKDGSSTAQLNIQVNDQSGKPPLPPSLRDNLELYLPMDDNIDDTSGNEAVTSSNGSPSFVEGIVGQAISLDNPAPLVNAPEYINAGSATNLDFGTSIDFSVQFWVKTDSAFPDDASNHNDPGIIANKNWNSGGNQGWFMGAGGDGRFQWNLGGGSRMDYDGPAGQINDGTWHHIVWTLDRDGSTITYIDNVVVNTQGATDGIDLSTPSNMETRIGTDGEAGATWAAYFPGTIDEVAIWSRVLSADEVDTLYNSGQGLPISDIPPPAPEILAVSGISGGLPLSLTWTSTNSARYTVYKTENLVIGHWSPIESNIVGMLHETVWTNYTPSVDQEFYKVEAE